MKCHFCGAAVDTDKERFSCRFCHAQYERAVDDRGRVRYEVLDDPDPEIFNRLQIRRRLNLCAQQVVDDPVGALELLQDTWAELRAEVCGDHYPMLQELTDLRQQVKALHAHATAKRIIEEG